MEIAPAYLGVELTMEAGRAVDKRVDPLMSREIGAGSRKEAMVGWCLERGVEPNAYWMDKANYATREKDPQSPTLDEKLPELKEACDRAKAGFEQRTGQKWYGPDPERMKPLQELQEIGAKRDKDVAEIFQAVKGAMAERQGERVAEAAAGGAEGGGEAEGGGQGRASKSRAEGRTRKPRPRQSRRAEAKAEQKAEAKAEQKTEGQGRAERPNRPAAPRETVRKPSARDPRRAARGAAEGGVPEGHGRSFHGQAQEGAQVRQEGREDDRHEGQAQGPHDRRDQGPRRRSTS